MGHAFDESGVDGLFRDCSSRYFFKRSEYNADFTERTGNKEGQDIASSPVSAAQMAAIIDLIGEGTISGKIAKDLFEIVWTKGGDPKALVDSLGMKQVTDLGAIEKVVDDIIAANPDKAEQARAKPQLMGWFVGQVMKSSGGKVNPQAVNDLLKAKLGI